MLSVNSQYPSSGGISWPADALKEPILSIIFSNLPLSDLKSCSLVSHSFRNAVNNTPLFRKIREIFSNLLKTAALQPSDFMIWSKPEMLLTLDPASIEEKSIQTFVKQKMNAAWDEKVQAMTSYNVFTFPWKFKVEEKQFPLFLEALIRAKTIEHFIFEEGLPDKQAEIFGIALSRNLFSFISVTFGVDLELTSKGFGYLCEGLAKNNKIRSIKFDRIKESLKRFASIGKIISSSSSLEKIHITGRINRTEVFNQVISSLIAPSSLRECVFTKIGNFQVQLIVSKIKQLKVEQLVIEGCNFDSNQSYQFAENLRKNNHLKKITLLGCHISENDLLKIEHSAQAKKIELIFDKSSTLANVNVMGHKACLRF